MPVPSINNFFTSLLYSSSFQTYSSVYAHRSPEKVFYFSRKSIQFALKCNALTGNASMYSKTSIICNTWSTCNITIYSVASSPSRRREAPCEGTNSPRLFTPAETKTLAESKVHQISRAWVTNDGWSSSVISKIWRTVMNSGHWLVQFKVCIITTASRQRNIKHFLIWRLINFLFFFIFYFNSFIERCSNGKSANGTRDPCEALSLLNFVYI
jgi:hypothetical protein